MPPATPAGPVMGIRDAIKMPTFWLLCGVFSICGGTANGLIGMHLIPHALEQGFDRGTVSFAFALMGTMNIAGTLFAGWLADRVDPRKLIAAVFTLRGAALFYLTLVDNTSGLLIFTVIYGLDWFATVPPVVTLAGQTFGKQSIGRIYGWIFLAHQDRRVRHGQRRRPAVRLRGELRDGVLRRRLYGTHGRGVRPQHPAQEADVAARTDTCRGPPRK